jgi:hypothetical protein
VYVVLCAQKQSASEVSDEQRMPSVQVHDPLLGQVESEQQTWVGKYRFLHVVSFGVVELALQLHVSLDDVVHSVPRTGGGGAVSEVLVSRGAPESNPLARGQYELHDDAPAEASRARQAPCGSDEASASPH